MSSAGIPPVRQAACHNLQQSHHSATKLLRVASVSYANHLLVRLFLQVHRNVTDLFEDLRDGHSLLSLLEVLSQDQLVSSDSQNTALLMVPTDIAAKC